MHNRYNKGVPVRISCTGGTKGVHYIRGWYARGVLSYLYLHLLHT